MARFTQNAGGTGSALNYVQVVGGQATITSAPSSVIDLDITTTGKPVQISVTGEAANDTAATWLRINLFRDGSAIGNEMQLEASATSENVPYAINFIDAVPAGTYNYSVRVTSMTGGSWQFGEVAGPIMNAVELTGFKGDDGNSADLVIPTAFKDEYNADFITITRTGTGTARIDAPQDDLSLRSAADITLYAGTDGPGNVYIGWGDAEYTPDSPNRVATIGDVQSLNTGDITFVNNTISSETGDDIVIQNKNIDDVVKARIVLDQSNEQVLVEAINPNTAWFYDTQWVTAEWSGNNINFNDAIDIYNFFTNTPGTVTGISVNDGPPMEWWGANYGEGTVSLNVSGTPSEDPTTVTEMRVYYNVSSKVDIDYDNGSFEIVSKGMSMLIDSSGDLELNARDEDIDIRANDDIRFTTNWNTGSPEPQWRMTNTGRFEFPGDGYIENTTGSSGDGYSNDTLVIVPDSSLVFEGGDQYLVIDPTTPNHIHIRAGGVQDSSFADLFLGAERTNVHVSDGTGDVQITSKRDDLVNSYVNLNTDSNQYFITSTESIVGPDGVVNVDGLDYAVLNVQFDAPEVGLQTLEISGGNFTAGQNYTFRVADGENYWTFDSNGVLYGPSVGNLKLAGITGEPGNNTFYISADQNLILQSGDGYGEYLNNSSDGLNQIATVREIAAAAEELTPTETSFTVNAGTTATQPTFNGSPLFSGTYVKTGQLVHFQIQVDMDNITSFGTGQYYVDLPFDAKYGYQFKEGCLHDISNSNQYAIGGHVAAGTSRLYLTYTGSNGQDEMFDHDSPVTLAVADNFHISGTYITN